MGMCDLCNEPGTGTIISAEQMRQAVFNKGFNPFSTGLIQNIGAMFGQSPSSIYAGWKGLVSRSTSDWNICPSCLVVLRKDLPAPRRPSRVDHPAVCVDPIENMITRARASRDDPDGSALSTLKVRALPRNKDLPRVDKTLSLLCVLAAVAALIVIIIGLV